MTAVGDRVPGREARAGKFDGPSLIPSLNTIQREHGWLPRRSWCGSAARPAGRCTRSRADLVLPALPCRGSPQVEVTVCRDLSCWLHGGEQQIAAVHERFVTMWRSSARVSCLGRCDIAPPPPSTSSLCGRRGRAAVERHERASASRRN